MKSECTNCFDYLKWRGDLTFEVSPLNCIDVLIFSQLGYLNFDGLLTDSFRFQETLYTLNQKFISSANYDERKNMGVLINRDIPLLFDIVSKSNRFALVKVCGYVSVLDFENEIQFSATTFCYAQKKYITIFRGTDDSIVGFKEDFKLAYLDVIPSQTLALNYFKQAEKELKGDFIIAGHSKGANQAMFVAVNVDKKTQNKISAVYNLDGPGFSEEFYQRESFKNIQDRLYSFYPYFSVVGMIFNHPVNYQIVKSSENAIMQHDPISWQLVGTSFVTEEDFSKESKFFYVSINEWTKNLSLSDKQKFVTTLFEIIESSGAKFNSDIDENKLESYTKMVVSFAKLDSSTRSQIFKFISNLVDIARANLPMINIFKNVHTKSNLLEEVK